jgi:hypothetical protein
MVVLADGAVLVLLNMIEGGALHDAVTVVADAFPLILFYIQIQILLRVDIDLFLALLIVQSQGVVAAAVGAAVGFEGGAGLVQRQFVRGDALAVVECAGDDGSVGMPSTGARRC